MIPTRQELQAGIAAIHEQARGVLQIAVVLPSDIGPMLAGALLGEPDAIKLAGLVRALAGSVRRAQRPRSRPLCATCPGALKAGRYSTVAIIPACDEPGQAMVLGVCERCATNEASVREKATEALRRFWPDARTLDLTPGVRGHA